MIEFLRKFENRSIKIARMNSIHITKSINLQLFNLILCGVGGQVPCDVDIFKLTASAQSINREVHTITDVHCIAITYVYCIAITYICSYITIACV